MAPAALPSAWQSDALPTELAGRWTMQIHKCTSKKRKEKKRGWRLSSVENATQFRGLELPADRMFHQKATKKYINEKMITVSRQQISDAVFCFKIGMEIHPRPTNCRVVFE